MFLTVALFNPFVLGDELDGCCKRGNSTEAHTSEQGGDSVQEMTHLSETETNDCAHSHAIPGGTLWYISYYLVPPLNVIHVSANEIV